MSYKRYYNKAANEEFLHTIHRGLDIIVIPKKKFNTSYAIYATKYGSINNKFSFMGKTLEVPAGIAHFLEHKMFEKEYGDAFARYAKTGASANAFTSFGMTAYQFSCTDKFEESLEILVDIVNTPYFTEKSVEKEQGIIRQEINMYLDNPGNRGYFNMLKCLYKNHPVRENIVGSVESIAKITPELLYTCYNAFYNQSNMVLCVSGDIDEQKVLEIADKNMRDIPPEQVEGIFDVEPDEINQAKMEEKMEVARPLFMFGIKDTFKGTGKELLQHNICCETIIHAITGRSNKFYSDLYNKGLINNSFSGYSSSNESYGYFSFSGESSEPEKVSEALCAEIERIKKEGIKEDDLKRYIKMDYGTMLNIFDNVEDLADEFAANHFIGCNPFDVMDIYNKINSDDINNSMKYFDVSKMVSSLITQRKGR